VRNKKILFLSVLTALLALTVVVTTASPLAGDYAITWWTVDGGGSTAQGGTYALGGTAGQADAGTLSGGSFSLAGGYWSVKLVKFRNYLPVIRR